MKKNYKQVDLVNNYKDVFKTVKGKAVLYDLMWKCGMLNASYTEDVNQMIFNEGKRSVILSILNTIDTNPDALKQYIEETLKEQELFDIKE